MGRPKKTTAVAKTKPVKRRRAPKAEARLDEEAAQQIEGLVAAVRAEDDERTQDFLYVDFLFDLAGAMDSTALAMIYEGHLDGFDATPAPDQLRATARYFLKRLGHI